MGRKKQMERIVKIIGGRTVKKVNFIQVCKFTSKTGSLFKI